jgi:hypothetical protein
VKKWFLGWGSVVGAAATSCAGTPRPLFECTPLMSLGTPASNIAR